MNAQATHRFGYLRAGLVLSIMAGVLTSGSSGATEATAILSIRLAGFKNNNGRATCALYVSERGFPEAAAATQTTSCTIASEQSLCSFAPISAGIYAVACYHDANKNGKMDTGLFGIPTEGVAVSNNAKGFMGPPKFKDARFKFSGVASELKLTLKYL